MAFNELVPQGQRSVSPLVVRMPSGRHGILRGLLAGKQRFPLLQIAKFLCEP